MDAMDAMDVDTVSLVKATDPHPEPPRKKIKASELPLSSATRNAIESLSHTFKKKGGYDALRKQVWEKLEASDFETQLIDSITKIAENELDVNQSLLSSSRGKAAILIEGVVDRSGVYQDAETHIKKLIQDHMESIEDGIRTIRREEIGEEAAAAEETRGSKTDEQYAEEAAERRRERERVRKEIREKELAIAEEKRKLEKARKREEERKREAEEEKRRQDREARRKAEREAERERERLRGTDRERDRERDRDSNRDGGRSRRLDDSRDAHESRPKTTLTREEAEHLEQEALDMLMREGKRVSQRSRHQLEPEVDETLAPPPRKAMPASAIKPISRDPPTKPMQTKKELDTKVDSASSAFRTSSRAADETKRDDRDRRSRARSRSRDRDYSRRESRDRDGRSRRSKDRDDRRNRSRDRVDAKDKDKLARRDSRERDDHRRRDVRDYEDRRRDDSRDRDTRSIKDTRDRDSRRDRDRDRDRSKTPRDDRRSYRERDSTRDSRHRTRTPPSRRDFKTAEEKKQEGVKQRELEAKAYLAAQAEARAKGLPIPGFDRPRTDAPFMRPNWRDHRGNTPESRKRDADTAGFSAPLQPREREFSTEVGRDGEHSKRHSNARSQSRASSIKHERSPSRVSRHESVSVHSPTLKRDTRDVERDKERDSRRHRDSSRRRSRSRSRSRSRTRRRDRSRDAGRDRDRDRDRDRARSRSRSHGRRKDDRKERSRSRDRDTSKRYKSRSRERERDKDDMRSSRRY